LPMKTNSAITGKGSRRSWLCFGLANSCSLFVPPAVCLAPIQRFNDSTILSVPFSSSSLFSLIFIYFRLFTPAFTLFNRRINSTIWYSVG
jgi:hypothetical protein